MSKTNYERIKSMTVEEMAVYLAREAEVNCNICMAYRNDKPCSSYLSCVDGIRAYLESEVEE